VIQRVTTFPRPTCEGCGEIDPCARAGAARPEYPHCHRPIRDLDLGQAGELLAHLAAAAGLRDDAVRAMERVLLERFRQDHRRWWNALELSFSCDKAGAHPYRFSYAFPGFHADPAGVGRTITALAAPFGQPILEACTVALGEARSPAVEQPLFGYANDGGGRFRVKLYLQFRAGAESEARALTERLLGAPVGASLGAGALHMLGLDLAPSGRVGAKLYVAHHVVRADAFQRVFGPVALLTELAERGVTELREVLAICRQDTRALGPGADEVDFSLVDNELSWRDVRRLPALQARLGSNPILTALEARFRLGVRRVSAAVGDLGKHTVYYVLTQRVGRPHV
jgi:hypothetical protein